MLYIKNLYSLFNDNSLFAVVWFAYVWRSGKFQNTDK